MFFLRDKKQMRQLKEDLEEASGRIAALEKQNSSIRSILESMVEGVITVDKDTRILSLNGPVEKIFGIAKAETEGRFFLEAIRNNDIAELISKVLKDGEFISQELTLVWPVQKTFQVNASPILDASTSSLDSARDNPERVKRVEGSLSINPEQIRGIENNTVNGCLLVIHDITGIRKLETIRRDFVANVSHELKTPLTSIKGFVETLLEGALEDKENSRHFLKIIFDHTNRLDSLINDLLDLSSLESKETSLQKEVIGLKALVDDILAGFRSQLKKRTIVVKNDIPLDLRLKADKNKLCQVLANFIDNAIKFNRENGTVRIYSRDSGDKIEVFVEDSGIGIPLKDIPRIFERFYRVDKARSRELGGTGLGLSIVKHIVELHGGSVDVETTEGLGSKFWFSLPK